MKRLGLLLFASAAFAGTWQSPSIDNIRLRGEAGRRMNDCIQNHVLKTDALYLATVFRNKDETHLWQTEFWGKWMHSAAPFLVYSKSPELKANIRVALDEILADQLPDGYIGNYREGLRAGEGWDVWGCKYTLLGLLHSQDALGDARALSAAQKLADWLIAQFAAGNKHIGQTGNWRGLASCSLLEPIVLLYNRTKEPRYLEFAKYIAKEMEEPGSSPHLISNALAGKDVAEYTPGEGEWKLKTGSKKAYEMMSCYQGLVELWRVTGDKCLLDATIAAAKNIAAKEVNIVGGAASGELWYHGKAKQDQPYHRVNETCVLTTWMRLCETLLEETGDSFWADELEKTFWNVYLASLRADGSLFAMYTQLEGFRSPGQNHCKMETNCCNANGPRGFLAYLRALALTDGDAVALNFYQTSKFSLELPATKETVALETFTLYPKDGAVTIWNRTTKPLKFTLKLRIPAWAETASVTVNGKVVDGAKAGTYLDVRRTWKPGDVVAISFPLTVRAHRLGNSVAFTRGPVALARDARFNDGELAETVRLFDFAKPVDAALVRTDDTGMWMAVSANLPMGLHSENPENANPRFIRFADFATAGSTWTQESSCRVWLPLERFARDDK